MEINKKLKEILPGGLILTTIIFLIITLISSWNPSSETLQKAKENQQTEFLSWSTDMDKKINFYDGVWNNGWKKVMYDLDANNIDNYMAYSKLKHISDLLEKCQYDFATMPELKELSEEHKDLLQAASQKLSTAAYIRKDAVQAAMQYLDDPKPSKQQEVLDNIRMSDSVALEAAANIAKVREDLNLPTPEKKK